MKKVNIKAIAASILASNLKLPVVYMTTDGQGFTTEAKAQAHQNTFEAKSDVQEFKRVVTNTTEGEDSLLDLSISKLTKALQEITDPKELNALLDAENAKGDDKRKGAVSAIEGRLEEIAKATEVNE